VEHEKDEEKDKDNKEKESEKEKEKEKDTFRALVNPPLFASYRFFDRAEKGYLMHHEMEDILNSLGHNLTQKQVRILIDNASSSSTSTRLHYKDHTHVELKEGETKATPDFVFSSDSIDEGTVEVQNKDTPQPQLVAQQPTQNFTDVGNLMLRLEKSEAARRIAVAQSNQSAEELHRVQNQLELAEKKYAELTVAAHANDAFFAEKIKEAANLKQILVIIKAALKRAEKTNIDVDLAKNFPFF